MNHQPFEDWLLDDQPLTSQQNVDLQSHLRRCSACTAIAESNLALRARRMFEPRAGFTDRFGLRLVEWQRRQRRNQVLGTMVLVLGGLTLISWLAGPTIEAALQSPSAALAVAARYLVFAVTSLRIFSGVSEILVRVLATFVSPAGWYLVITLAGGSTALFWALMVRRLVRSPQGV